MVGAGGNGSTRRVSGGSIPPPIGSGAQRRERLAAGDGGAELDATGQRLGRRHAVGIGSFYNFGTVKRRGNLLGGMVSGPMVGKSREWKGGLESDTNRA